VKFVPKRSPTKEPRPSLETVSWARNLREDRKNRNQSIPT
jgi:hypothetical protein